MSGVDEGDETDRTEDPTHAGTDADAGANTDPDPQTRRKPVVVVVEPETPGNVGTIARAMKNFGLSDLKLVDPPELKEDGEAYGFAGHAREDVLPERRRGDLRRDRGELPHGRHHRDHRRGRPEPRAVPLQDARRTSGVAEDRGRTDGDRLRPRGARAQQRGALAARRGVLDPGRRRRPPVLNLGQAATVLLYELRDPTVDETQLPDTAVTRAPEPDVERFHEFFGDFLEATGQREHHRDKNALLVRRLLGRAHPTEREIHSLLGTFRKANVKLEHADHLAAKYDEPVYPESDRGRRPPRRQLL